MKVNSSFFVQVGVSAAIIFSTAYAQSELEMSQQQLFLQNEEQLQNGSEVTPSMSLVESSTVYTQEDFEGLFTYLEMSCDGPKLMACQLDDKKSISTNEYLLEIDECLSSSSCLSYHQILSYKQKLNEGNQLVMNTAEGGYRTPDTTMAVPQVADSTNDLELAEVNYLCIVASIDEQSKTARQNTFNYCLEHLTELFEAGQYSQAINTTFLTQTHPYTWQMIAIFGGVFAVLGLSLFLMCRFMKNKGKDAKRSKRSGGQASGNRGEEDDDDRYVDQDDSEEAFRKKIRVPRAQPQRGSSSAHRKKDRANKRDGSGSNTGKNFNNYAENSSAVFGEFDKGSGLNVPLLDYSEGTGSHDDRSDR